jgi:predicted phage terminase large subunit-like protein
MIRASFEENDDMASWFAQDQQEPIERFGALFTPDNMQFFNPEIDLPDGTPDRIFAALDPAYGGGDFVSMPICWQFGNEYYVVDAVYNDGDKDVTVPEVTNRMASMLDKFERKTAEVHFEETKTTSEYRNLCEKAWKEMGVPVNATHDPAPNTISKLDRIKNHAPDIRKLHFVDMNHRTKEYNKYIQNILSFKYDGKNKHDDGVDSTAQLCDMIYSERRKSKVVRIIKSPV